MEVRTSSTRDLQMLDYAADPKTEGDLVFFRGFPTYFSRKICGLDFNFDGKKIQEWSILTIEKYFLKHKNLLKLLFRNLF